MNSNLLAAAIILAAVLVAALPLSKRRGPLNYRTVLFAVFFGAFALVCASVFSSGFGPGPHIVAAGIVQTVLVFLTLSREEGDALKACRLAALVVAVPTAAVMVQP